MMDGSWPHGLPPRPVARCPPLSTARRLEAEEGQDAGSVIAEFDLSIRRNNCKRTTPFLPSFLPSFLPMFPAVAAKLHEKQGIFHMTDGPHYHTTCLLFRPTLTRCRNLNTDRENEEQPTERTDISCATLTTQTARARTHTTRGSPRIAPWEAWQGGTGVRTRGGEGGRVLGV